MNTPKDSTRPPPPPLDLRCILLFYDYGRRFMTRHISLLAPVRAFAERQPPGSTVLIPMVPEMPEDAARQFQAFAPTQPMEWID